MHAFSRHFSLGQATLSPYAARLMQPVRRAVIDVGTNSVKVLVADVSGQTVQPVWEEGNQTRLGEGFYHMRRLQPRVIERTAQAVAQFVLAAGARGAQSTRLIATSAAREAVNSADLVAAVERRTGLKLEIISGDQEAEWAYLGVTAGQPQDTPRLLIMEVGGGSTQFILGEQQHRLCQRSLPLGAVRLLEKFRPSDPPTPAELQNCRDWLADFMRSQVQPALGPGFADNLAATRLLGTGGTAVILARMALSLDDYDRARIESARLTVTALGLWVDRVWSLSLADRRKIVGLPPPRADVMLTGAAIYEAAARHLGFPELRVSSRGLRFGAMMAPPAPASLSDRV